jgi:hypothetical protein
MNSQGSTFRSFNINNPSLTQATFSSQMNSYIAYSGWGPSEPSIQVADVSTVSGGNDSFGNPIVAYKFQTEQVLSSTVPSAEVAWYTWIVPTGATNNQIYSDIEIGTNPNSLTVVSMNSAFSALFVNYTGSTNIPAGVYRVYTTKPGAGSNITNSGNNYYFRGGNLI